MASLLAFLSPRHRWIRDLYTALRRARVPVRDAVLCDSVLRLRVGSTRQHDLDLVVWPARDSTPAYATIGHLALRFEGRHELSPRERRHLDRVVEVLRRLRGRVPASFEGFSAICLPSGDPDADLRALFPFLDIERSRSERGQEIEALVRVTSRCNQACPFCSAPEHETPSPEALLASCAAVSRLLPTATVTLTGGEPTIRPRFLAEVATARGLGVPRVNVQTNAVLFGRRLDPAVLEPGPDLTFFVSLHAVRPELYDACTGSRGQLPLALEGARRLLAAGHGVTLNVVVTTHNVDHLESMVRSLPELFPGENRPSLHLSALMCPERRPGTAALLVPYRELAPALEGAAALAAQRGLAVDSLLSSTHASIPACTLGPSARAARGRTAPALGAHETGYETRDTPWVKALRCRRCSEAERCLGVPRPYARRFGLGELVPLSRATTEAV